MHRQSSKICKPRWAQATERRHASRQPHRIRPNGETGMRKKVTVVGGGFVGSTTAQRIHDAGLADVVLTDILDGVPAGKALDMLESGPVTRTDARVQGISTNTGDYRETAN